MNIDFDALKAQLVPSWSAVNIVITILAFLWFWPLGLLMIAYIIKGADFGLNLAQPSSFMPFFRDIGDLLRETTAKFTSNKDGASARSSASQDTSAGGTPMRDYGNSGSSSTERDAFESWRERERDAIKREREALEKEKAAFAAERRKLEENT